MMRKIKFIFLIFLMVLFGLFSVKTASAATITLSGQISDNSTTTIQGAAIEVIDSNTNTIIASTTSDNHGDYAPLTGKATFGFVSKYQKGANVPSGNTQFNFEIANFNFHSTSYDWLVIAGSKAQYKGTGTINGNGSYKFILTAVDGNPDKFRLKVWDQANNTVIYDNQPGALDTSDPTTTIGGGSIIIHK